MDNKNRLAYLKRITTDTPFYMENELKIRNKHSKLVPFKPNPPQLQLNEIINKNTLEGKPHRYIILKARQLGFSTFINGYIFKETSLNSFINSLIIAHEDTATQNLFNMSKLFYEELNPSLRPMKKYSNEKALVFENPTNDENDKQSNPGLRSKITVATAGSKESGRSGTFHNLHISEAAFFPNAQNTMTALLQCVPDSPNTHVFVESTANGVGGYFYDLWNKAVEGKNDFTPVFFPWFVDIEYVKPFKNSAERNKFVKEVNKKVKTVDGKLERTTEWMLMKQHNLTYEQLNWRKSTIENKCNGDEYVFKQEYPSTPEEAFISSGRPRFDIKALEGYLAHCKDPLHVVDTQVVNSRTTYFENPSGFIEVYKLPEDNKLYTIGADVAEGLKTGDYSVGVVLDDDFDVVAKWRGHIDPDLFGFELVKLARMYNEAYLAVEANNHGLTTIKSIIRYGYDSLYYTKAYDKYTDTYTKKVGWYTNSKTKPILIDKLAEYIREKYLGLPDKAIISECLSYVRDDKGRTNAQSGKHDDCVMALAIALQGSLEGVGEDFIPEKQVDEEGVKKKPTNFDVIEVLDPLFEADDFKWEYSE